MSSMGPLQGGSCAPSSACGADGAYMVRGCPPAAACVQRSTRTLKNSTSACRHTSSAKWQKQRVWKAPVPGVKRTPRRPLQVSAMAGEAFMRVLGGLSVSIGLDVVLDVSCKAQSLQECPSSCQSQPQEASGQRSTLQLPWDCGQRGPGTHMLYPCTCILCLVPRLSLHLKIAS